MLVLSRRPGEKLVLPDLGVTIQVVSIKPGVVRLGVDAPPDIRVLRAELLSRLGEADFAEAELCLA
jgi:carbon storage regulator CsrA